MSEAYKTQAELEVQLNVTKSNLALVSANNEMLEEALKRNNAAARDVGWRRGSSSANALHHSTNSASTPALTSTGAGQGEGGIERSQSTEESTNPDSPPGRFFRFRFSGTPQSGTRSRPSTPSGNSSTAAAHLTSPSMPTLSSTSTNSKDLEDLLSSLEAERSAKASLTLAHESLKTEKEKIAEENARIQAEKQRIKEEKEALEAEIENLSVSLFEEANKMVAEERKAVEMERRVRAAVEEELREVREEKEALRRALRLMDEQAAASGATRARSESGGSVQGSSHSKSNARTSEDYEFIDASPSRTHSRSSSNVGLKSRPGSLDLSSSASIPPRPLSPSSSQTARPTSDSEASPERSKDRASPPARTSSLPPTQTSGEAEKEEDNTEDSADPQPTPRYLSQTLHSHTSSQGSARLPPPMEDSPWADVQSAGAGKVTYTI